MRKRELGSKSRRVHDLEQPFHAIARNEDVHVFDASAQVRVIFERESAAQKEWDRVSVQNPDHLTVKAIGLRILRRRCLHARSSGPPDRFRKA